MITSPITIEQNNLITCFLQHVTHSPHRIAIMNSEVSWTYEQLYQEVCRFKALFTTKLKNRVVLYLQREPRLLAVLLALQWLEITYIPVELKTPFERLRSIVEDSQADAILYDVPLPFDATALPCLALDLIHTQCPPFEPETTIRSPSPNVIAYLIYTSGSTGKPKGVMIARSALDHFLRNISPFFLNKANEIMLAITTLAFDIAAMELYLPIWKGKTVFLCSQETHQDPESIIHFLNTYAITHLQATPSMWSLLKQLGWQGKSDLIALCGGEALPETLAAYLLENVAELWNMYGPTETTIWCALKRIELNKPLTIGQPLPGMRFYVLDENKHPLPDYVKGELFIGGKGLAEGYLNQKDLTQARFITGIAGIDERLYASGDIACRTTAGEFIIFGRTDHQIKLHGHRIELEEIESQLYKLPEVKECAVVVHHEQLFAYISLYEQKRNKSTRSKETILTAIGFSARRNRTSRGSVQAVHDRRQARLQQRRKLKCEEYISAHLTAHLPDYMLPKHYIFLDALPRTPSGKVDRHKLPEPETTDNPIVCSKKLSQVQETLLAIWSKAFQTTPLSIHDNFFELGGNSLIAAQIVSEISRQLNKHLLTRSLFQATSIAKLAELVEQAPQSKSVKPVKKRTKKRKWLPLNDFQLLFWFSAFFEPAMKKLNVCGRKRIQGTINKQALEKALQWVYNTQESFSYAVYPFSPLQKRKKKPTLSWIEASLLEADPQTVEAILQDSFEALYQHTFKLGQAGGIFAKLFYLKDQHIELQISLSHLKADQHSVDIFFDQLSKAYLFYTHQHHSEIAAPEERYDHFTAQQHHTVRRSEPQNARFWKHYLKKTGIIAFTEKTIVPHTTLFSNYFELEESLFMQLRHFCERHALAWSDVLFAIVGLALKHCCQNEAELPPKLYMNLVKSMRESEQLNEVIGCFLQLHPIRLDLDTTKTLLELAKHAEQSALETAPHQHISSLIKLASIGQTAYHPRSWKFALLVTVITLLSKMRRWHSVSSRVLKACQTLAITDHRKRFVINLNIEKSFFSTAAEPDTLLGASCQPLPFVPYQQSPVNSVLDVVFFKASDQKRYLVVSANLTPEFRARYGNMLLKIMRQELN